MHPVPAPLAHTLVVIPTYNEVENLRPLAERLLGLPVAVEVLCVDDDSPDGTGQLADEIAAAEPRFHVIHRTADRGYARSSKEGFAWGLARDYDVICTMDGDLSHDPEALLGMVARLGDDADLVIGSRYTEGGALEVDWNPIRRAVSEMGSTYARTMIGTQARDCTSGYRCYRASALRDIDFATMHSDGYSFLIEVLSAFVSNGARIKEHPITYVDRLRGKSKISRGIIFEALLETSALGIRRLTGKRQ
jgi:glycosyltransferase involved in cell wall biosynthesis